MLKTSKRSTHRPFPRSSRINHTVPKHKSHHLCKPPRMQQQRDISHKPTQNDDVKQLMNKHITNERIDEYLDAYGRTPHQSVASLRQSTIDKRSKVVRLMLESGTCTLLDFQLKLTKGLRCIEVGTFTGVTSMSLALGIINNAKELNIPLVNILDGIENDTNAIEYTTNQSKLKYNKMIESNKHKRQHYMQQQQQQDTKQSNIPLSASTIDDIEQQQRSPGSATLDQPNASFHAGLSSQPPSSYESPDYIDNIISEDDLSLYSKHMLYNTPAIIQHLTKTTTQYIDNNKDKTHDTRPLCITLDKDISHIRDVALEHWQDNNIITKPLIFMAGNAIDNLNELIKIPGMKGSFDMVFIDADKGGYMQYYESALLLVKKGGLIMIDNVLWKGKVCQYLDDDINHNDITSNDPTTTIMHEFNAFIHTDKRVYNVVLNQGDGLSMCIKL